MQNQQVWPRETRIWPRGGPSKGRWRCVSTVLHPIFLIFFFLPKRLEVLVAQQASLHQIAKQGQGLDARFHTTGRGDVGGNTCWWVLVADRETEECLGTQHGDGGVVARQRQIERGHAGCGVNRGRNSEPETMQRTGRSPVHVLRRPRRAQPHRAFFSWHVRIFICKSFFLSFFLSLIFIFQLLVK